MPLDDYSCNNCDLLIQDVLHEVAEIPYLICPNCSQTSFTRRISTANWKLKGTGWYSTDFGSGYVVEDKVQSAKAAKAAEEKKGK